MREGNQRAAPEGDACFLSGFAYGGASCRPELVIGRQALAILGTDAGTVRFRTHGRRDVIGEVGLFHGSRSADVTA